MLTIGIIAIIALLIGYKWGKRDGMVYIARQHVVKIPLVLRQQSLDKGYCILCHQPKKKRNIYKINRKKKRHINSV